MLMAVTAVAEAMGRQGINADMSSNLDVAQATSRTTSHSLNINSKQ